MTSRWRALRSCIASLVLVALLAVPASRAGATSLTDLPPALQTLSHDELLSLLALSYETGNVGAEMERMRIWSEHSDDPYAPCPALAKLITMYPRTSDARRALLDIATIYGKQGDWVRAEAPFRYVMETQAGQPAARIAHFRMVEMHRYAGPPPGVDSEQECRAAIQAYAGTPEEGLGQMLLGDILTEQKSFEAAYAEYQRGLESLRVPQLHSASARIQQ